MDGAVATVGAAGIVVADMSEVTAGASEMAVYQAVVLGTSTGADRASVLGRVAVVPAVDTVAGAMAAAITGKLAHFLEGPAMAGSSFSRTLFVNSQGAHVNDRFTMHFVNERR